MQIKITLSEYLKAGCLLEAISIDTNKISHINKENKTEFLVDTIKLITDIHVDDTKTKINVEDNHVFYVKYTTVNGIFTVICFPTDITLIVEHTISTKYKTKW
jgi:hypothetical protein